jgi:hypothetical protein
VAYDCVNGIYAERYDASGNAIDAAPFLVSTTGFENSNPSVALDNNGHFIITYVGFNSSGVDVMAQEGSDSAANPLVGGPATVASSSFSSFIFYANASVATNGAGETAIVYEADGDLSTGHHFRLLDSVYPRIVDSDTGSGEFQHRRGARRRDRCGWHCRRILDRHIAVERGRGSPVLRLERHCLRQSRHG